MRGHVKTEAETGAIRPEAQGRLEPPDVGRDRKDPPPEPSESTALPAAGFQTSGL